MQTLKDKMSSVGPSSLELQALITPAEQALITPAEQAGRFLKVVIQKDKHYANFLPKYEDMMKDNHNFKPEDIKLIRNFLPEVDPLELSAEKIKTITLESDASISFDVYKRHDGKLFLSFSSRAVFWKFTNKWLAGTDKRLCHFSNFGENLKKNGRLIMYGSIELFVPRVFSDLEFAFFLTTLEDKFQIARGLRVNPGEIMRVVLYPDELENFADLLQPTGGAAKHGKKASAEASLRGGSAKPSKPGKKASAEASPHDGSAKDSEASLHDGSAKPSKPGKKASAEASLRGGSAKKDSEFKKFDETFTIRGSLNDPKKNSELLSSFESNDDTYRMNASSIKGWSFVESERKSIMSVLVSSSNGKEISIPLKNVSLDDPAVPLVSGNIVVVVSASK